MKAPLQPGDKVMISRRTSHPEFWDSSNVMWGLMKEGRTHTVSNVKMDQDNISLLGHSWSWRRKDLVLLLQGGRLVKAIDPNLAFRLRGQRGI
jgi:hypothetical protein